MAKSTYTEKDHGWNTFTSQFQVNAGETAAFVGYLRSSGQYKNKKMRKKGKPASPITMAQLAALMVYGSSDGRIPARDFMSKAIKDNQKKLEKMLKQLSVKVAQGQMKKKTALGIVAQFIADQMVAAIDNGMKPANAPSTIRAKGGKSKPLIDTGQLKNSIDWEVKEGKK